MHEPELPDSVVHAIEQRVRRRTRRQLIVTGLTLVLVLTGLKYASTPIFMPGRGLNWEATFFVALAAWISYAIWYVYQALVERRVQREIVREHKRQMELARASGRVKREERYTDLAALTDDREALLADDGELWLDDEVKPKRHFES